MIAHVAIPHVDVSPERFAAAAHSVADSTPRVLEVIARWQAVQFPEDARREFARRAVALRWDATQPVTRLMPANRLLEPVRGDRATDLWTTFNVVQEHLLRGGTRYAGYIPPDANAIFPTHFVRNTARPVGGIQDAQMQQGALDSGRRVLAQLKPSTAAAANRPLPIPFMANLDLPSSDSHARQLRSRSIWRNSRPSSATH